MTDPDCTKAYQTVILLRAARKRQHDRALAARSVRELLDLVRPLATRTMDIEYAQAMAYLALNTLYDRLTAERAPSDELWAESERAVAAWKLTLPKGPSVGRASERPCAWTRVA